MGNTQPSSQTGVSIPPRYLPQQDHADLGLIPDSDRTEDLRPRRIECAPGRCANTAEGDQNHPTAK